ncbi:FAD-binding protein, partial [Rhodovulum sulfidophilum]|nr:FAD-binding protein [Rhodovulum sulfidophilum]
NGGVYISMAHLGPDDVRRRFKGMVKRCADCGFDLAGGLVEVVPTAHYFMGGVVVDPDTRTEIDGLHVAGEDAGGAHGANRLGGNGVANSTVFGGIAGDVMGAEVASIRHLRRADEAVLAAEIDRAMAPLSKRPGQVQVLREALQEAMWEDV